MGVLLQEFDSMKCARERGRINSNEFVTMFQEMATRPEIYFLLIRFANRDYFTAEDFQNFLECEQSVSEPSPFNSRWYSSNWFTYFQIESNHTQLSSTNENIFF